MSQALYRKWRPARFSDVVGQEHITRTLQNSVIADRIGHAFLFSGPRGTGKTTSARLLAKAVNCLHEDPAERPDDTCHICRAISEGRFLDLIEIDAASNNSVDNIRDLRDRINFAPSEGRFKVYIIDEVHMLSQAAFNALLKTLEEPPPHAIFVLATTEEHKVPITIQSRCQLYQFRLLSLDEIMGRLLWLAEQESLTIEPEALALIARQGAGSLRDAESLLDQLVTSPGDTITLDRTQKVLGTASSETMAQLTQALLNGDGGAGLATIHSALSGGADVRQFARQMVGYLRGLLLLQSGAKNVVLDVPANQQAQMGQLAGQATRQGLIHAIRQFSEAATTTGSSWQPQLPLELAFIDCLPDVGTMPAISSIAFAPPVAQTVVPPVTQTIAPTVQKETVAAEKPVVSPAPVQKSEQSTINGQQSTANDSVKQDDLVVSQPTNQPANQPTNPLTIPQVQAHWASLMNQIRIKDRNLGSLLAMCKPVGVEGQTLVLGFEYPMLKEKFDELENAGILISNTLTNMLKSKCNIRTVLTKNYKPPRPTNTPAPPTRAEFQALADELGGVVTNN